MTVLTLSKTIIIGEYTFIMQFRSVIKCLSRCSFEIYNRRMRLAVVNNREWRIGQGLRLSTSVLHCPVVIACYITTNFEVGNWFLFIAFAKYNDKMLWFRVSIFVLTWSMICERNNCRRWTRDWVCNIYNIVSALYLCT